MSKIPPINVSLEHWQIICDILHRHIPQYEVWAFGSRVSNKPKPYSDLDLAIITEQPMSIGLSAALEDAFLQSDLPFKVDLVDWSTTSSDFRSIIEQHKVIVQPEKAA